MKYAIAATAVLLVLGNVQCYIPASLSVCNRADPELDKCVRAVVEGLRSRIASGDYGEGHMLPSLDPAYIDRLDIDDGANLQASFRNLTVTGAKNFQIDKLHLNVPEKNINFRVTLDKMNLKGKYNMKMKLSLLLIDGVGDANLDISDSKLLVKMHYQLLPSAKDPSRLTMQFDPIEMKIKFAGPAKFNFTNLLKDKPRLSEAANEAVNEDPSVILEKAKPAVQQFFSKLFTDIANGLMKEATEEEALPL
ncbi:uncharacterized protein LOC129749935 [Uranotaenia lowii]|uniref:uncharacterized protein LOC129742058 n=1 Tax=Uranotaenia lowii TaxID=190385 RepID=UPI002479A59C|nr:uncharacterized protein LOC129742058 [Uranotaenia lowii]XP_055601042.1 uncharacterized protein LOC129749935 [Uranotaenia lowii]